MKSSYQELTGTVIQFKEKLTLLYSLVTATWGERNTLLHRATPCETKDGVTTLKLGPNIDTAGSWNTETIYNKRDTGLNFKPARFTRAP